MKTFNKEDYNRMCADFLDIKYSELHKGELTTERLESEWMCTYANLQYTDSHDDFPLLEPMDYLKFHTDWNWIMEVVEKIENLSINHRVELSRKTCVIYNEFNEPISAKYYKEGRTKKEAVVQAIWEFLQWYKQNLKQ